MKRFIHWLVCWWPFGYLCDFEWGRQGRIRLTKTGYVIVGDKERDGSIDALPVTFVSEELVQAIKAELEKKWYWPKEKP